MYQVNRKTGVILLRLPLCLHNTHIQTCLVGTTIETYLKMPPSLLSLIRCSVFLFNLQEHFVLFLGHMLTSTLCLPLMVYFLYSSYQTVSALRAWAVSYSFLHPLLGLEETVTGRHMISVYSRNAYLFLLLTPSDVLIEYPVEHFKNSVSSL